jgi:hypothetical protein
MVQGSPAKPRNRFHPVKTSELVSQDPSFLMFLKFLGANFSFISMTYKANSDILTSHSDILTSHSDILTGRFGHFDRAVRTF